MDYLIVIIISAAAGYFAGRWHAKRIAATSGPTATVKGGGPVNTDPPP